MTASWPVRDLKTGELRRIDAADPAAFTAYPRLSADNRYLALVSADPGDTGHTYRAYVRDLRTGRTVLAGPDSRGRSERPERVRPGDRPERPHGRLQQFRTRPRARRHVRHLARLRPSPEVTDRILRRR